MESNGQARRMRIAWAPGYCPIDEGGEQHAEEVWVKLIESPDRPNEREAVFSEFLEENAKEVYEQPPDDGLERVDQRSTNIFQFIRHNWNQIKILDRHVDTQQLLLERLPIEGSQLILLPNTYPIKCQINALKALQYASHSDHLPLLRLLKRIRSANWGKVKPASIQEENWLVLKDSERKGTDEQRRFVKIALNTPDFALLEGPPGSGKTTAICELILQLAKRGKRILLCGSTHIAVDNVLERLMDESNRDHDTIFPVRIGDLERVSEKAQCWHIEEFVETERKRILDKLKLVENPSESQSEFKRLLEQKNDVIERMVLLDAANLVCGTTIGILQHPDILAERRKNSIVPKFDVLIIDEASKTPFQEFLVPALWAKRWIIVGDPKQLSPYVDDKTMAINIEACLPDEDVRNACIDTFLASNQDQPRFAAIATTCNDTKRAYAAQCDKHDVKIVDIDQEKITDLSDASIVIGKEENLLKMADELPLDVTTVRNPRNTLTTIQRRDDAWQRLFSQIEREQPRWESEVGWRTACLYDLRFIKKSKKQADNDQISDASRLERNIEKLLPVSKFEECRDCIERVRRVAFPSILELLRYGLDSLQSGFEQNTRQKNGTALFNGLPEKVRIQRHVLLSTQHRMHPEIAEFSHKHIYNGKALITPDSMKQKREWNFRNYSNRSIWIDVPAEHNFRNNINTAEAEIVVDELRKFDKWAERCLNPSGNNAAWEVAVLTFYRRQEQEIRKHLKNWTKLDADRYFYRGTEEHPYLTIELCTVDRFQGHEADVVLISFVNRRPTYFLESPNRLNVALTRARYQRIAIGDREAMAKGDINGVLQKFANDTCWDKKLNQKGDKWH